jgi:hypothetical protein
MHFCYFELFRPILALKLLFEEKICLKSFEHFLQTLNAIADKTAKKQEIFFL